ncbi:tRNA (adenosine(37)-N6)-threonylcarbamoyltransferase complex ATPase subunit type 1 TsaE [Desulfoprunum benzoelyticum]|nr:tRNA (adenosine(37)-N6)-threonylcarbamoyltransferase complex ATPase subunit type 1 TsaE [Desulfoprunum benzoelyticum]
MGGQISIYLKNLEETRLFGCELGKLALPGDVICLDGDLGAGKTTLTQAIAQGLQVPDSEYVTSPSFAVLHQYPGRIPLYHMDFYRLHDAAEILDLGLDEYFSLSGLTVIEWPIRAAGILPAHRLDLTLENPGDDSRIIRCTCPPEWEARLAVLFSQHPGLLPASTPEH